MFEQVAAFTILQEGGFVFNPLDGGGMTNFGITIDTLSTHLKRNATADDVKNMTLKDARAIYKEMFWDAMQLDKLDGFPCLQMALFDFAINSGQGSTIRTLQNCIASAGQPLKVDGVMGSNTIGAINRIIAQSSDLMLGTILTRARRMLMARICQRDKSQVVFLADWIGRTHALDAAMTAMAQAK